MKICYIYTLMMLYSVSSKKKKQSRFLEVLQRNIQKWRSVNDPALGDFSQFLSAW